MGVLASKRHELFAQEVALGKTALEAYTLAGYRKPRAENARRLRNTTKIKDRVKELSLEAAEIAGVHLGAIQLELARIGFANIHDMMQIGEDGEAHPVLDIKRPVSRALGAAVQELGFDSKGRPKVKLHDKRAALDTLAKMIGGVPDPIADSITGLGDRLDRAMARA